MNANFGLLPDLPRLVRGKRERKLAAATWRARDLRRLAGADAGARCSAGWPPCLPALRRAVIRCRPPPAGGSRAARTGREPWPTDPLQPYLDHLGIERGLSPRTVTAYGRDIRDFLATAVAAGAAARSRPAARSGARLAGQRDLVRTHLAGAAAARLQAQHDGPPPGGDPLVLPLP